MTGGKKPNDVTQPVTQVFIFSQFRIENYEVPLRKSARFE